MTSLNDCDLDLLPLLAAILAAGLYQNRDLQTYEIADAVATALEILDEARAKVVERQRG